MAFPILGLAQTLSGTGNADQFLILLNSRPTPMNKIQRYQSQLQTRGKMKKIQILKLALGVLAPGLVWSHPACNALSASKQRSLNLREQLEIQAAEKNGEIYNCFIPRSDDPCLVLQAKNLRPLALEERLVLEQIQRGRKACKQ